MAYGNKYTIKGQNEQTGDTWTAYIKERDYTGSTTELTPGPIPINITYRPIGFYGGTDYWNIASAICEVQFIDDTTGLLSEVLNADDEQFQILIEDTTNTQDEWIGFVIPDSYSYSLYSKNVGRLRATDRLEDLKNITYTSGSSLFTGRDDLIGILSDCLSSTNFAIGLATHMNWYPHIGSNDLDTTDDPLLNLKVDRDIMRDADNNPFSKFDVLEQICMSFQLQLYQVEKRWHFIQRKRNVFDSAGTDVFKVYNYTSAGAADTPSTSNLTARREVSVNSSSGSFAISPSATGTAPVGQAGVDYFHDTPSDGLLQNTGFQSAIQTTGGDGIDNWRPGGTTPTAVLASPGILSTQALYMDSIYESTTAFTGVADAIANLNDYVEQTTNGTLTGGTNIKIQVDIDFSETPTGADVVPAQGRYYLFVELHVGTYKCFQSGHTGVYDWATSPTTDEEKLHYITTYTGSNKKFSFTTEALDDSGSIDGAIYFKIYAPTEDKNTVPSNTAQVDQVLFDNITLTILDTDEEANTAQKITLTYANNVNRTEPARPTLVFGDGPDSGYRSRLTVLNSLGAEQAITQDWSYLPSVAASGFSLHQFWANQILREYARTNRKLRCSVISQEATEAPKPYHYLIFENPDNTQQHDYTWNDLSWRPATTKQLLSGSFVQFQEVVNADQICTVDIKSDTAQLRGISLADGLPCFTGVNDDFTPTLGPTHLYWIEDRSGTDYIARAAISETLGWTRIELAQIATGRTANHIRVDQSSGFIFTIENVTATSDTILVKRNLDGSGATDIVNPSSISLTNFDIDRIGKTIMINEDNDPAATGFDVEEYDYSGTFVQQIETETGGAGGWTAYDETGTVTFVRYFNSVGPVDEFRRNGTDILNTALSGTMDQDEVVVDEGFGKAFIHSVAGGKIVSVPMPSGGSESDVITTTIGGEGLGKDRLQQKLYYPSSSLGVIRRANYDGTGAEDVYDDGVVNASIKSIDMGFN